MYLSKTAHSDKLKEAIASEKLAAQASLKRYTELSGKISAFQVGGGPAPTEEEFNQWVAGVQHAVELKRLLSGLTDV